MKVILLISLIVIISCNTYRMDINRDIVYSNLVDSERMMTFDWSQFGINDGEIISQIQIEITTNKMKVGYWQGVLGTSTTFPPFWFATENMREPINDNQGFIIWNIPEFINRFIEYRNGKLQFCIWWIDCDSFTLKSITAITL